MMRTYLSIAVVAAGLIGGCAKYYKVTDPTTGRTYYTQNVKTLSSGATELKDARYGGKVVLQNTEVHEISREQYETERVAQAAIATTRPASESRNPVTP